MDASKLVVEVSYSDDKGILRFTQTIRGGASEVKSQGLAVIFGGHRNDRQVIVYAYTPEEKQLGLIGYDVPVTVQAGDVVPYPMEKVLDFVTAFEPTDEQQNAKRERQYLDATQHWREEKKNYKASWKTLANEFYKALRNRKAKHKVAREKYQQIMAVLDLSNGNEFKTDEVDNLAYDVASAQHEFKALSATPELTIEERLAELDNLPGFGIIPISATVSDEDIERIRREWAEQHPTENGAATE